LCQQREVFALGIKTAKTVVYLVSRVSKAGVINVSGRRGTTPPTYVAPATTSSIALAFVELDKTATKMVVATTIVPIWVAKETRKLQIRTGANKSIIMTGVINVRADRAIDDLVGI
jgi:hypothetical protein